MCFALAGWLTARGLKSKVMAILLTIASGLIGTAEMVLGILVCFYVRAGLGDGFV
jgi:hypothetical protein